MTNRTIMRILLINLHLLSTTGKRWQEHNTIYTIKFQQKDFAKNHLNSTFLICIKASFFTNNTGKREILYENI